MGFRGLMTGVSGLKANSKKMEVIGNNLANVNTTGYKKDRVNFYDVFYQVIEHGSQGDGAEFGGTNSKEIGMGVQIGSIDKIFTQGTKNTTGRTFDFMIEGDDFFVAQNSATKELMLTRNGAFQLDGDWFLVDSVGNKIQGFNIDKETQTVDATAKAMQIQSGSIDANATTKVNLSENIDSSVSESSATQTTNTWEIFSGGENFGKMTSAITGLTGIKTTYGSGYYQDSINYTDSSATLEAGSTTIVLNAAPENLIDGFSVGDTVSLIQGSNQVQRTISAIDSANRRITISTATPSSFTTSSTITISNLTDGTAFMGSSGTSLTHNDILRSQVSMVDQNGKLLASFYRVSASPSDYSRATSNITGGGGSITIGTGEFTSMNQLSELAERTLRDTQLTNYASSIDLDVDIDKFGKISFSGTGLVNEFRLVINAENTEMIDRFSGIAITDAGTSATTQARVDSSGEIIAPPSLALGTRSTNTSKNWFDSAGLENYGFSTTNSATEYGEYAGLRLDGGSNGEGFGVLQLSTTNGLGNTALEEFKLVSRDANASNNEFSTMGELANLIQTTLRNENFSSLADNNTLITDLTATASFSNGRLNISTSNGSFRNLKISPLNTTVDTSSGLSRSDQENFGTVLGSLSQGFSGKAGSSNMFIQSDVHTQTKVYDSQGNEHTAITYFVRDRSSGLENIEWKFMNGLQPNINTFVENSSDDKSVYRPTFNSIQDTALSRGVVAFDINTGGVLDNTSNNSDSRYLRSSTLTFSPQNASSEAQSSSISIDFTGLNSYNGDHTVVGNNLDGYTTGSLVRLATQEGTGEVKGVYSNGQIRSLAKIGLMHIDNPEALQKMGTSYFIQTNNSNSGGALKSLDNVFSVGTITGSSTDSIDSKIQGSSLEASNVDITEELTQMIVTQRSYSASGKTITTVDDMIQEALSLKR